MLAELGYPASRSVVEEHFPGPLGRRAAAHAFYGHLGFTEHSRRFIKPI